MDILIQPITPVFDSQICSIIRKVGAEFGAVGEGFGPSDLEVSNMSAHYHDMNRSLYLIALINHQPVGGCGIAPFDDNRTGNQETVCELKKLFLLPQSRGLGIGRRLVTRCLDYARSKAYQQCYLDTLAGMSAAIHLYETLGFRHLDHPLPGTIHHRCNIWMLKELENQSNLNDGFTGTCNFL
jgi:putative acetyltransferase